MEPTAQGLALVVLGHRKEAVRPGPPRSCTGLLLGPDSVTREALESLNNESGSDWILFGERGGHWELCGDGVG